MQKCIYTFSIITPYCCWHRDYDSNYYCHWNKHHYLQCGDKSVIVSATNIKGVGYRQANQATVQSVSGNDSKQSSEKHHQISQELQTNGQPPVEGTYTEIDTDANKFIILPMLRTSHEYSNVLGFVNDLCLAVHLVLNIWPVWHYPWVDSLEVFINSYFIVVKKSFLMAIGSYHWQTRHCLTKMWVYRRARHRVQPMQLPWTR